MCHALSLSLSLRACEPIPGTTFAENILKFSRCIGYAMLSLLWISLHQIFKMFGAIYTLLIPSGEIQHTYCIPFARIKRYLMYALRRTLRQWEHFHIFNFPIDLCQAEDKNGGSTEIAPWEAPSIFSISECDKFGSLAKRRQYSIFRCGQFRLKKLQMGQWAPRSRTSIN